MRYSSKTTIIFQESCEKHNNLSTSLQETKFSSKNLAGDTVLLEESSEEQITLSRSFQETH